MPFNAKKYRHFSIAGFVCSVLILFIIVDSFRENSILWKLDSLEGLASRALILGIIAFAGLILSVLGAIKSRGKIRIIAIFGSIINSIIAFLFLFMPLFNLINHLAT